MKTWWLIPLAVVAACEKPAEKKAQKWTCAMHPQILREQPGDCPICGMRLTPVGDAEKTDGAGLQIDVERRRLIGLKTVTVSEGPLATSLRTTGRVSFDETRVVKVTPRFEGFIEQLHANYTGKFVK